MLKQSCNQLPDAITRSRIFCDHLSQCAMVVGVLQGLRNARERAMYSNIVLTLRSLRSLRPHLRSLRPHPSKPSSLQRPPPPPPPPFDPSPSKASKASKPPSPKGPRMQPLVVQPFRQPHRHSVECSCL